MKKGNKIAVMTLAMLTLCGIIFLPDAKGQSNKLCALHYGVQRMVNFIEKQVLPDVAETSFAP